LKIYITIKPLPIESQFSVVNGVVIDDFNNDNIKDIMLGGNRFEAEIETTRSDASIGPVLFETNSGHYRPLNQQESGLFVPYNVKSIRKINLANNKKGILIGVNDGKLMLLSD